MEQTSISTTARKATQREKQSEHAVRKGPPRNHDQWSGAYVVGRRKANSVVQEKGTGSTRTTRRAQCCAVRVQIQAEHADVVAKHAADVVPLRPE